MVFSNVVHLQAKNDPESIKKLAAKLQEASQTYRLDKETLDWFVMQSTTDETQFTIVERYKSQDSVKYHTDNPYFKNFFEVLPSLIAGPPDLRAYNELDTSIPVFVEQDNDLWDRIKKHQELWNGPDPK